MLGGKIRPPTFVALNSRQTLLDTPSVHDGNGRELRRLHDISQKHILTLKAMGQEPSPAFITSLIELKLNSSTMFEWQPHSQSRVDVPHYKELLEFLDHRAQASGISTPVKRHPLFEQFTNKRSFHPPKSVTAFATNHESDGACTICKTERHPLYSCPKFRSLTHDKKTSAVKASNSCMNCLGKGHRLPQCKSLYRCKRCQGQHHTFLHLDPADQRQSQTTSSNYHHSFNEKEEISVNTATLRTKKYSLLMTCEVQVMGPSGSPFKARALIDSGSSSFLVSKRIAQSLRLTQVKQKVSVTGIGGGSADMKVESVSSFDICSTSGVKTPISIMALIVPRIVNDLPTVSIPLNEKWHYLSNLQLADPNFNVTGRIDLLLGIDVFTRILLTGRHEGSPGSPVALETLFGWVLCGDVQSSNSYSSAVTVGHTLIDMSNDTLRRFWEIEEPPNRTNGQISQKERSAVQHFKCHYTRLKDGQFVVPLPKDSNDLKIGESRSRVVRRFISLERSLRRKNRFSELDDVIREYFDLQHAEPVPSADLYKPPDEVFYLPIHAVYKRSSTTTKVRAVSTHQPSRSQGYPSMKRYLVAPPYIHLLLTSYCDSVCIGWP